MVKKPFSQKISVFHGSTPPESTVQLVGYAALMDYYKLEVPLPHIFSGISCKHKKYSTQQWQIFTPRYMPEDSLHGHLVFALKYEGVDLHILKQLFLVIKAVDLETIIQKEPTSQYTRRLWFLYEWLLNKKLRIPDISAINFVDAVDTRLQYGIKPIKSYRHRVNNNLPGTQNFCPLIRKTQKLEHYLSLNLNQKAQSIVGKIPKDILLRAAAFLLLNDSKSSFAIEGEIPSKSRAQRWSRAIAEAGLCGISSEYLIDLQKIILSDKRFTHLGFRKINSFIGVHDRITQEPIPDHITAKPSDIPLLMDGLLETYNLLKNTELDPVLIAAVISFGFVFIHPFEDGNGRIHRYLMHHILAEKKFTPSGIVFPVSSVILEKLELYRETLEAYSNPRLPLIEWSPNTKGNVHIHNKTKDLYAYFDCTQQAEFLFECIQATIEKTFPQETDYLIKYDKMRTFLSANIDMPEHKISLLIRFLEQNNGKFSKRALQKEFASFTQQERKAIEDKYSSVMF